jgi:hypothetical protein
LITGYNKAQVDKILNREDNKDILQECLKFEIVRKSISQKDMESVVEYLNEIYSAKKMAKIVPLLIMLFVSVDERVNAEKIIGNASFFMYAIPIYYMTINKISEIGEASVPRLKHCEVGELEVNYQPDDGKLSTVLMMMSLKKCKINKLVIKYKEEEKDGIDMTEEEIREYLRSVNGEIDKIEWVIQ